MPLVLSVAENEPIYVGKDIMQVHEIHGDGRVTLLVLGIGMVQVGDKHAVEVVPGVMISAGLLGNNAKLVRLIFNAPRSIGIGRYDPLLDDEKVHAGGA